MSPAREHPVLPILILLLVTGLVSCKSGGGKEPDTDPTRSGPSMPDATSGDTASGSEKDGIPTEDVERSWQPVDEPDVEKLSSTPDAMADRYNLEGVLHDIFFGFDRSELNDTARRTLALNAGWLRTNPEFGVLIEGHCDERGTEEYNLALGDRRAEAARSYLESLGVGEERIETISYGEERPVDDGHNESAWAKNRRGHFVVTPK